jgi:glycosyltransferase involved in cell wall biosynthesis
VGAVSRPTVLVLASTYPRWRNDPEPGFVHELCKRLASRFNVIALVPDAPGADPCGMFEGVEVIRYRYAPRHFQALVNNGGIVTNLRRSVWKYLLVPGFLLGQYLAARRILKRRKVDVIHAHWLIPQGLIANRLGRWACIPYLVTSHGGDLYGLRGSLLTSLKQHVVASSAATTVVSSVMREELARTGADVSKVRVQPMGVELSERFIPDVSVSRSAHEILFLGRLVEKKGLYHLIEAMPVILAGHPQAHLTVAGFGPEESALRMHTQRLGLDSKVTFIGAVPQEDLPRLYRRAAVFVAPFVQARSGDQEGLGLVCIEAMGCGCPVVVSDLPATRDVLPDSLGCVRVEPGDSRGLAEAVLEVLRHPAPRTAGVVADRQALVMKFDWQAVGDAYAEILLDVVSRPGPVPSGR